MKSRAAIFHGPGQALDVREIDLEEPGPLGVLVRMARRHSAGIFEVRLKADTTTAAATATASAPSLC